MAEDDEYDAIKNGDRPVPPLLRRLPAVRRAGPGELDVDQVHDQIHIYLSQRLYSQCLEQARVLFDWYVRDGYFPVPCRLFNIKRWPAPNTELYRLLFYCNRRKERGLKGEWPL